MSIHLQREIDKLKRDLLLICSIVEEQVQKAVRALFDRDTELAREVQTMDEDVDRREINLEEECLKTLALHQPVAINLRQLIAALKINNDLERIGDMAVNIARKAAALASETAIEIPADFDDMGEQTQAMLRNSLDALVQMDAALARDVCVCDDQVDQLKKKIRNQIEQQICQDPERIGSMLRLLSVSRNLERIADCAVNIAEDVIYMVDGRIVRHQAD
ncbi:MAG: phosphate signaling complex protein PhoU [Thermoguttaceae bacterium]|jgi:phosphate transport system protein